MCSRLSLPQKSRPHSRLLSCGVRRTTDTAFDACLRRFLCMDDETSESKSLGQRHAAARRKGLLIMLAAAGLGYLGIASPLQDAAAHAPAVRYSFSAAFGAPFAFLLGLLHVALGDRVRTTLGFDRYQTPSSLGWVVIGALTILALGAAVWLDVSLTAMGYRI